LTVSASTNGAHGAVSCTETGQCTYAPASGFKGSDVFTYTISDGRGGSDTASVAVTVVAADTAPPSCTIDKQGSKNGRPFTRFRIRDAGSGLARYEVVTLRNATVAVDPFTAGTTTAVFMTATAITNDSLGVSVDFYDVAGNRTTCDPIMVLVSREEDQPEDQTFTDVPQAEHYVTIQNGNPGMRKVKLVVNRTKFKEVDLRPDEVRSFDIAAAMKPGNANTITVSARGKKGGSAVIVIADIPPASSS
jgi:hypothetical protein